MTGNNAFLYIILVALAAFGIYSGYKTDGWSGALQGLLQFGLPVLVAMAILSFAGRKRKK